MTFAAVPIFDLFVLQFVAVLLMIFLVYATYHNLEFCWFLQAFFILNVIFTLTLIAPYPLSGHPICANVLKLAISSKLYFNIRWYLSPTPQPAPRRLPFWLHLLLVIDDLYHMCSRNVVGLWHFQLLRYLGKIYIPCLHEYNRDKTA